MKVKVGIIGVNNVTAEFFLLEDDKEVENMHAGNWKKVAPAVVRRKVDAKVYPIEITAPEWKLPADPRKAA